MELDPIKEELLKTDENFKKLYEEHVESKKKVQEIQAKGSLSEEDESEIKISVDLSIYLNSFLSQNPSPISIDPYWQSQ